MYLHASARTLATSGRISTATRKRKPPQTEKASPPVAASAAAAGLFPVVGIGASAGGLAAIEEFLTAMPDGDSPSMAIVIVQHLDPDHKSLLLDLVERYTRMHVAWAEDGMEVRPGHAYVMPPNKDMALVGGLLRLAEPEAPRGQRLPIDHFFRSLATDQRERAVCIVLSGTGSDGTLGLRAVKGEGGMAIVQIPETAAYDGMPRAAIATGLVDYLLRPAEMPEQLIGYISRAFGRAPQPAHAAVPATDDLLPQVLRLLRDRSGHDFTRYKATTLRRRVERRMAVTRVEHMKDYLALLKHDTLEAETLFRELLIGVTSFFRDTAAFAALDEVLPGLIAAHAPGDPVRVWVPGCSTGEEAYSIAMLLQEQAAAVRRNVPAQIFATDIDAEAIERARAGVYPGSIVADLSSERLERFFIQDDTTYRVTKAVRDCLVFAKQDVTRDPPFSRVDLISCRNLLIYMDGDLQQRLMPLFHYAINPDGYLLLGSSETVGAAADLFAPVDRKWKLFRRRSLVTPHQPLLSATMPPRSATEDAVRSSAPAQVPLRVRVRDLAERALLDRHAPACVVINAEGDVLYIHGHTGRYLEPPVGEPSGSLFKMAREGLRLELSAGVRKALAQGEAVRYERLRVRTEGGVSLVNLIIEPMPGPDAVKGVLLVLFEDLPAKNEVGSTAAEPAADREQRIADLDRELSAKEEYLRTTIEELETSNEELKSTNEEMQSSNEELQSTNEELETSREELQSVNEELVTVNSELQQKIEELSRVNNDMNNMIAGTGIGTLFVDQQLLIQRFTPAVTEIMNLIPSDIGRPLSDITPRLTGGVDLVGNVTAVLDTLAPVEAQVESGDGRTYQMRVRPYRTLENVIEGAVLTFVDVTEQRQLQTSLDELATAAAEAGELAQCVLDAVPEPQLVLDGELAVVTANKAFLATFEQRPEAVLGCPLAEIDGGAWSSSDLLDRLTMVLPTNTRLDGHELSLGDGAGQSRTATVNAVELVQSLGKRRLILLTVTDLGG